ncbi:phosphatidylinositol 3- and 4-kinase, putative [Rhizoctonia solani AG-1 IA]|uniref:non-specific serine/threonine protein kinase n=1 Tax=Thanatephorus cucumeris (strain AG1-IA) TaxID=983506 RepID=L8WNK2_THACA|nr:phosphatidylinositol 3- and 4-kinase, putative [Rhizoctonia solani AG-1 IA]
MDYDGLPVATQPLALLDNRSTKQVTELLQTLSQGLALPDDGTWLPINHPDNQHISSLLVTLSDSVLKGFPRPGKDPWEFEWRDLCILSLNIQARALPKVAVLYDEKKTRPPNGYERTERAWLAMLFADLGLANAWLLDESSQDLDSQGLNTIAQRCVDVTVAMLGFLGGSLMLGDDPERPAWEQDGIDVIDRVPSAVYPLEASLFTTPRIYAANSAPESPASISFPIASSQALLTAGISALSMLISTLSTPLSADAFLKSYRQSTAFAICEVFSLLEVHHEPKLIARLLELSFTWLEERPSESTGIAAQVWKLAIRRIHTGASPNEPHWHIVDDELAKIIGLVRLEATGSSWSDIESVIMLCASNDTMSNLRVALCQLLTAQVHLLPYEALEVFQNIPVDVDDSSQVLLDLRRAVDSRAQKTSSKATAKSGKRKRDDQTEQETDVHGDTVMRDGSQVTAKQAPQKRISFEYISSNIFDRRRDWLAGGLGPNNEDYEAFEGRVLDSLTSALENQSYVQMLAATSNWAAIPCALAHPTSMEKRCPSIRTGTAKTVSRFFELCMRFNSNRGAYDGLASAIKHLSPDHYQVAFNAHATDKVMVLLGSALERPERSVRLAAGRAIVQFVEVAQGMQRSQQDLTARPLAITNKLVLEGKGSVRETARLCHRVASEDLLGHVILTHITLLQQQNLVIKGLAYAQILEMASFMNKAPFQLLSPYFKQITPLVVEKLSTSSDVLPDVCRLLTVSPRDFLTYTRAPALAAAIKSCNKAVIDVIAGYVEQNTGALLLENAQEYLTEILLVGSESSIRKSMSFLCRDVLNEIIQRRTRKNDEMTEARLLGSCGAPLIGELVIQLGSEDIERRDKVSERATPAIDLPAFLTNHLLGIVMHINDALQDVRGKATVSQKIQMIKSLGVVVKSVGASSSLVSPQIMATLQSMIRIPELSEATLSTWHSFIETLLIVDAVSLLGVTTATVVRHWGEITPKAKEWAIKILEYIIVNNGRDIRQNIDSVVSLSPIDDLKRYNKPLKRLRSSSKDPLEILLARCRNENMNIAVQSLQELKAYLLKHRATIEGYMVGDVFSPWLGRTMKVLFEAACREGDGCEALHKVAYECIGIVGALDPDRLDIQPGGQDQMVMRNFEDEDETVWFIISLISDVLVSAFRSTTDLKYQRHLAYAIQELLRQCGFNNALVKTGSQSVPMKIRTRWKSISPEVVETVGPLLEGRFTIQSKPPVVPQFPIYSHSPTYREWIQTWTAYLISCVKNANAAKIFEVFRPAIRNQDVRVAKQILPHLIIAISQSEEDLSHITQEIVTVLRDQIDNADSTPAPRKTLSAQTVFDLMDQLNRWIRNKNQEAVRKRSELRRGRHHVKDLSNHPAVATLEYQRAKVESLLSTIDNELLSNAAFRCRAFARSLMSFEKEIVAKREQQKTEQELQPLYERLHEIYANLDEPDGMEGVSKLVISPSLEQQIRGHEMTGRWTSAQSCWEIQLQQEPNNLEPHIGLLRCLRNLGHNDAMKTHIHGVLSNHPMWESHLADFAVEGAWTLGDLEAVKRLTSDGQRQSPEMTLGRLLLSAQKDARKEFDAVLENARNVFGGVITANGSTSYRRSYEAVLHLHMAREIESIYQAGNFLNAAVDNPENNYPAMARATLDNLTSSLEKRFKSLLPTFRVQEPVLSMRRTPTNSSGKVLEIRGEIGQAWLTSSKIALKASHFQTAYSSILQAQRNEMAFSFIQGCKLTKALGEPLRALQEITHAVENPPKLDFSKPGSPNPDRQMMAKALLLRARWTHEADRYESNEVINRFAAASKMLEEWESPHFRLGQYYDDAFKNMDIQSQVSQGASMNMFTCSWAILSRQSEINLLCESLDQANRKADTRLNVLSRPPGTEATYKAYKSINAVMSDAISMLKPFQWFTALPQLLSRVTHPNRLTYKYLAKIIISVVISYPQQALWCVSPLGQSRNPERAGRGREILEKSQSTGDEVRELIMQSRAMVKELLAMSERDIPENEYNLNMQKHFPALGRLAPSKLIMPLQDYLTVNLPVSPSVVYQYFSGFNDEVDVMKSLQKPRKITAQSEDGHTYIFLCKPKDDLRKDARLMDFNSMINKLLKKNAESRRRQLRRCHRLHKQVMEWVQHKAKGLSDKDVHEYWVKKAIPSVLINLHEYFISYFSEPTAWLSSRLAYTRTTAVMSMVGHILGLGDRHGENLMFDTVNGDLVHVDLNCLFERGKTFEIPETVPFRLTANMVDGFGVTGVEGAFRTACEVTMHLLRDNYGSLISVLDAFVHDPLVEWEDQRRKNVGLDLERDARLARQRAGRTIDPRGRAGSSTSVGSTDIKELARNAMLPIGHKIQGVGRDNRVMTVSNQVEALIREATDPVRLARMYVGWMSWI